MDAADPRTLARLLVYGQPETRRVLAQRLLGEDDGEWWALLMSTVRSQEPWRLRARCLEVLGLAAGSADEQTAERILGELLAGRPPAPAPRAPINTVAPGEFQQMSARPRSRTA